MKNIKLSRFFAAVAFAVVLLFAGCKQAEEEFYNFEVHPLTENDGIVGTWFDDFEYNSYGTYDCCYSPNIVKTASYGVHEGTIYIKEVTKDSGYIYYEFDHNITGYTPDYAPLEVESKGKWCAIAYKVLTENSVKMCDAFKDYTFASTKDEAVALYTISNGYFAGIDTTFTRVNNN